jgi:hypothetical protein
VIRNEDQYRREAEFDRWETLRRMTPAESIALGEALLTSEIMRMAVFPDDDQPVSLAIALGIRPGADRTSRVHHHGGERV